MNTNNVTPNANTYNDEKSFEICVNIKPESSEGTRVIDSTDNANCQDDSDVGNDEPILTPTDPSADFTDVKKFITKILQDMPTTRSPSIINILKANTDLLNRSIDNYGKDFTTKHILYIIIYISICKIYYKFSKPEINTKNILSGKQLSKHNSASLSTIFQSTYNGTPCIVKSFKLYNYDDFKLILYKYFTKNSIHTLFSNIALLYEALIYRKLLDIQNDDNKLYFINPLGVIITQDGDKKNKKVNIIMEDLTNTSVSSLGYFLVYISNIYNDTDVDIKDELNNLFNFIFYRIFKCISVLAHNNIYHNDVHLGNFKLTYNDKDKDTYELNIKIYDYDHSYCPEIGLNPYTILSVQSGQCIDHMFIKKEVDPLNNIMMVLPLISKAINNQENLQQIVNSFISYIFVEIDTIKQFNECFITNYTRKWYNTCKCKSSTKESFTSNIENPLKKLDEALQKMETQYKIPLSFVINKINFDTMKTKSEELEKEYNEQARINRQNVECDCLNPVKILCTLRDALLKWRIGQKYLKYKNKYLLLKYIYN